jgi:hypothetical protein
MAGWLEVRTCAAGGGHHGTGTVEKIPFRITMEELHKQGGVPQGWKFTFPIGDFQDGRKVFVALECYQCHRVAGETFPKSNKEDIEKKGPDLTGMGDHHPIEYFAESIIHPNAVIVIGDGYTTSEGFSVMPEYGESLTLKQLIDLVTYLKKLTLQDAHPYNH